MLAPGLDAEVREVVLTLAWDEYGARDGIPVVELVADGQASRSRERHFLVPWPCRPEDLERQIEAVLMTRSEMDDRNED